MNTNPNILIIYDGGCPLCVRARDWLTAHDRNGRFDFVPCASEEQRRRAPQVSEDACRDAMHVVTEDGQSFAGADAIARILPLLPSPWPCLGVPLKLPGVRRLAPHAYAWMAKRRRGLSAMLPGHTCDRKDGACPPSNGERDE